MQTIKETIQQVLESLERKKAASPTDEPEQLLKKILTARQLRHIQCTYLKKGVCHIGVDSSAWLYQFNLEKEALLAKVQKLASQIRDMRFFIGDSR